MKTLIPWFRFPVLAVLLFPFQGYPISRVGNGHVNSPQSAFSTRIARQFCREDHCWAVPVSSHGIQLRDPDGALLFDSSGGSARAYPKELTMDEFSSQFPRWALLSRAALTTELERNEWRRIPSSHACVETWINIRNRAVSVLSTWGEGRGTVIYGPNEASLRNSALAMIRGLELEPGACAWK